MFTLEKVTTQRLLLTGAETDVQNGYLPKRRKASEFNSLIM
jgi:hypothetical protein